MTVFELQDSTPLPPGRRIQLADGREGVLIWEYEPRGGQGSDRREAIGVRVSVLFSVGKRRRFVTSVFSLEMTAQSVLQREISIVESANEDCRTFLTGPVAPGLGVAPTRAQGDQCAAA